MNRNYLASFCIFFAILHVSEEKPFTDCQQRRLRLIIFFFWSSFQLSCGLGDLWFNNPATKLLEIQLQNAFREQQQLATRLIRAGIQQTQLSSNQIQVAKVVQTTAAITLASKGLFDVCLADALCHGYCSLNLNYFFLAEQHRSSDCIVEYSSMLSAESLFVWWRNRYG